jgi:hypothetical protein
VSKEVDFREARFASVKLNHAIQSCGPSPSGESDVTRTIAISMQLRNRAVSFLDSWSEDHQKAFIRRLAVRVLVKVLDEEGLA